MFQFEPRRTSIANYGIGHNHWFLFVVVTSFILTLLWSFFYLLQLKDSINMTLPFSWLKLEYYYTLVVTVLYAVAFIVLLAGFGHCVGDHRCDSRTAAGVSARCHTSTVTIVYILKSKSIISSYA